MTNLWVIEAISVNFGTKRRYRYLQQDIREGTWKFPCTLQLNIWQGTWKFPCTLPCVSLQGTWKFSCALLKDTYTLYAGCLLYLADTQCTTSSYVLLKLIAFIFIKTNFHCKFNAEVIFSILVCLKRNECCSLVQYKS